jgi:hypothetical protein
MKAPEGLAHCVGGIPWVPFAWSRTVPGLRDTRGNLRNMVPDSRRLPRRRWFHGHRRVVLRALGQRVLSPGVPQQGRAILNLC